MDKFSYWTGYLNPTENIANAQGESYQTNSLLFLYKSTILCIHNCLMSSYCLL